MNEAKITRYGLGEEVIAKISDVFSRFPEISEVIIFGSRVKGNYAKGSDIDLALLSGDSKLSLSIVNKVSESLDELFLPYTFDLVIFNQIDNQDLLDHIKRVGVKFAIEVPRKNY